MKKGDKHLAILMVIGLLLVGHAHYDAREQCLASKKPDTDSTSPSFASPFTGQYKRSNGVLYCRDSKGSLHAHREK